MKPIYLRLPKMDADGAGGGGTAPAEPKAETKEEPKADSNAEPKKDGKEPDTLTKEQHEKLVAEKIAAAEAAAAKKQAEAVEKAKAEAAAEAEKMAKLSEEERAQVEKEKAEKSLADREAAIARKELLAEAKTMLGDKNLPASFAEMVIGEDADKTQENIDAFAEAFSAAVEAMVTERLKGKTPGKGDKQTEGEYLTREQVEAMSQEEVLANLDKVHESQKHWG